VGTEFTGTDSVYVEGKDTSAFYAATNTEQSTTTTHSKSTAGIAVSIFNETQEEKTTTDSKQQSTSIGTRLLSNQKVQINVGNSAALQGTDIQADQIAFTQSDPSKDGQLILGGSVDTTQTSHTEKTDSAMGMWEAKSGHGSVNQTLNQTSLEGQVSFDNALKITAQIPKGDLQTQIQTLGAQGGLSYLNALADNPNVHWDQVALAHKNWDYGQEGLSSAGAALVAIAIAVCSGGTAAGLAAQMVGQGAMAAALSAGMVSLAAQASVAMINNGGDLNKTMEQLGSEQSVKNLLATMVTAGAMQGMNQQMFGNTAGTVSSTGQSGAAAGGATGATGVVASQTANQFTQNLLKNVTDNVGAAAINSAINGQALDESTLSAALSSALVTAGMVAGANAIGDAASSQNGSPAQIDAFTQKVAHAVLGCAGGAAAAGGGDGCSAGAVGAVVGEMAADYATNSLGMDKAKAAGFAKIMSATAGVVSGGGGDNAAAVNVASTTGGNAAENNRLLHKAETRTAKQLAAQSGKKFTQAQIEDAMRNSSNKTYDEDVTAGMVNPGKTVSDKGAVFQSTGSGVVQVLPNNGNVDPALAAFIIANTGGANSPYAWMDVQLGLKTPPAVDPNAGLTTIAPNANGCVTPECSAGIGGTGNKISSPDYITVQGSAFGVGVGASVNLLNGDVFVGASKGYITPGVSVNSVVGTLLTETPPEKTRSETVSDMLGGGSAQVGACIAGVCMGINQSMGINPPTAVEIGIGTPGISVGGGASFSAGNLNGSAK
jgi:hypothetical protein